MIRHHQSSALIARRRFQPEWFLAAALAIAVFLVYQPAWQGGFIWDDEAHVTRPELRSWQGLYRIWFDLGATQQYYPLLHSVFWIEHKLWGDAPLGYHLVSIFLHALAALMVAVVLRRLAMPGAYLAAAIFALHPVQVESVAWITELKNTLSAVFYLSAAMLYLRFDQERKKSLYAGAMFLFVLGLLSKTVTATLPAALLVIFWWQLGQLSWRRDVLPLAPFFILGAAAGLFTAWVERKLLGAEGAAFDLTFVERFLIAGRVIWFYLCKLFWPSDLIFIYPRWEIDQAVWWQYLFPAAALLLLAVLWVLRGRWRGPLAGLLFFVGTLFPVLGFFNVFPFIYSFVADHFQYLASLGVIVLVSAGIALLVERWRIGGYVMCLALLTILAGLTWRQSRMYADVETLYQTTIDRNPSCLMAHINLGSVLVKAGRLDEGTDHYRQSLRLKADNAEAYNGLGIVSFRAGRLQEAIEYYRQALHLKPTYSEACYNLGLALDKAGRLPEAIEYYQQALRLSPNDVEFHNNLGIALARAGRLSEAIEHYRQALRLKPDYPEAHNNLGLALDNLGRYPEAIEHYRQALRLKPDYPEAHNNLGADLWNVGRQPAAIEHYQQALRLKPDYTEAHNNLGVALSNSGRTQEAIEHFQKALSLKSDSIETYMNLALTYAKLQQSYQALAAAQKALDLARSRGQTELTIQIEDWLNVYRASLSAPPSARPPTSPLLRRLNGPLKKSC